MATVLNGNRVQQAYSVVLMARLVDRQGHIIGPDAVDSIEHSVAWSHDLDSGGNHAEVICDGEPLCVADVIFPEPRREPGSAESFTPEPTATEALCVQRRGRWLRGKRKRLNPDGEHFNFRHCFVVPNGGRGRFGRGARLEVRYVITQTTGETTIVRFYIRMTRNDRHGTDSFDPQPDVGPA